MRRPIEWMGELRRMETLQTVSVSRRVGTKKITNTYRFAAELPLRDTSDALLVNLCELATTDATGKVTCRDVWATSHAIDAGNVVALVAA